VQLTLFSNSHAGRHYLSAICATLSGFKGALRSWVLQSPPSSEVQLAENVLASGQALLGDPR
jgi:hypothetical protein